MARANGIWAAALAGAMLAASAAAAGEPAPGPQPPPKRLRHPLGGIRGRSSIATKKRPWHQHVLLYLPSRALDMVDCLAFEVAAGEGLHANLHATRALQLGYGHQESTRVGLNGRHVGFVDEELRETALGWWWELDLKRLNLRGSSPTLDICEADVGARYYKEADPAGVGLALFVGLFGTSVELRLYEVADLLEGFLTFDPSEDDL